MDKRSKEVFDSLKTRGFAGCVTELSDGTLKFVEIDYSPYLDGSYWTLDIALSILTQAQLEGKSYSTPQEAEAAFQHEKRDICRVHFDDCQYCQDDYVPGLEEHEVSPSSFVKWAKSKDYIIPKIIDDFLTAGGKATQSNKDALKMEIRKETGGHKGKRADKVKSEITAKAIEMLDAGCKCHNTELARFLMDLKNSDGTPKFILPGIMKTRYEDHFLKATNSAFDKKHIPLRNKPKNGEPRGQKLCKRPDHAPGKR